MADRLISADALKNYLAEFYDDARSFDPYMDGWTYESFIRERIFKRIDEQPTVEAEQAPANSCASCVHWDRDGWHMGHCECLAMFTSDVFYCGFAKREQNSVSITNDGTYETAESLEYLTSEKR